MSEQERFFVDERIGCVAVRDRQNTDDSPGLHFDSDGVVKYWAGNWSNGRWEVEQKNIDAAKKLCAELNIGKIIEDMETI